MSAGVRTRIGLVATMALAVAMVGPTSTTAADAPGIPDAGHFVWAAAAGGGPFVGVVHAVRRTSGVTVLYLSVGTARSTPSGQRVDATAFLGYGVQSSDKNTAADSSLRLTRLVDTAGGKVYRPIQTTASPECVCTPMSSGVPQFDPATQLVSFAAAFPNLPTSVTSVDVDVTGKGLIVPNVPVSDGAELSPTAGTGTAVVMGTGWPKLDVGAAASVTDVSPFITDLVSRKASTDNTVRSTSSRATSTIDISSDVLFAVDQATLSSAANARLVKVAAQITASATGTVQVTGYTDDTGSVSHNQDLSERRARSVLAALKRLAPSLSFAASGRGENDPAATNATTAGRQLNRRVSVQFAAKGAK